MKQLISIIILLCLPFCLKAEKKVSKIYDASEEVTQLLSYDEQGRLKSWKEYDNRNNSVDFDLTFNYVDKNKIILSGIIEGTEGKSMEATLNDENLVTLASENRNESHISMEYKDGIMTKLTWWSTSDPEYADDKDITVFPIENGNPVKLVSDYWSSGTPIINYSDKPNKCGLVYLPIITCNTAWAYRVLAYAGLLGYGSRTLPSSCRFWFDEPLGDIDYTFDSEGYIISMKVTNGNDGNGEFYFEYTDVNGIGDIVADESRCKVYSRGNQIIVEGEYSLLTVYNLQGVKCNDSNLAPGIYIAEVDGERFKVLVK